MRAIGGLGAPTSMGGAGRNHVEVSIKKTCENQSVLAGLSVFNYWQLD